MKKFLTLALVAMMALTANAQIVSSRSRSITRVSNNYSRIYLSYTPVKYSFHGYSSDTYEGLTVGWLGGFGLSSAVPIYLEVGPGLQYNTGNDCNFLAVNVPVNVAYKFNPTPDFSIVPYAGVSAKVNILGDANGTNMFDNGAKRIQAGWQLGCGINYKRLYAGVGYQGDITDYAEDTKSSGVVISIGLNL